MRKEGRDFHLTDALQIQVKRTLSLTSFKVIFEHRECMRSQGVKNRQSGPSKMIRNSCEKHFVVVYVDEYRTTKCCRDCHAITKGVPQKFIGPLKEGKKRYNLKVRGLRRCESNECRSCPLKPRDYAAAWNIGVCWPTRPPAMSRSRA